MVFHESRGGRLVCGFDHVDYIVRRSVDDYGNFHPDEHDYHNTHDNRDFVSALECSQWHRLEGLEVTLAC